MSSRSISEYGDDSGAPFKGTPEAKVSTTFKVIGVIIAAAVAAGVYGENLRGKLERLNEHNATMEARQGSVEKKVDGLRDDVRDMAANQKMYLKYLVDRKGPKPTDDDSK